MKPFSIIVAVDEKMGIGKNGALPWKLSEDMAHFKSITTADDGTGCPNVLIMGRKTWESLPVRFRPLPGRVNAVLTADPHYSLPSGVWRFSSFEDAIKKFCGEEKWGKVFVIGGAQVFSLAMAHPLCTELYQTRIQKDFACDVFFPQIPASFCEFGKSPLQLENGNSFLFYFFSRR